MAGTVAELNKAIAELQENTAREIGYLWDNWNNQRQSKINELLELRNFIFATDTSTTTNSTNGWKNSTTVPKICQIRDNLHANYISSLFPNDNWMQWEGYREDDETRLKKEAILAYMRNKVIESGFTDAASDAVLDYIDTGCAFGTVEMVADRYTDPSTGEEHFGYVGPRLTRIGIKDIVFNPIAPRFEDSPKILRQLLTMGEVMRLAKEDSDWKKVVDKGVTLRKLSGEYSHNDFHKAVGMSVDGFGSFTEYLSSSFVEVLTFYGDYFDKETGETITDAEIKIVDRAFVVYNKKVDTWIGKKHIFYAGWRKRPDNLYAMGPLDNLVGMQYRLDHLENLKADAQDLVVHPPLKIIGDVDPFEWGPGARIFIPNDGDVVEMGIGLQGVINAENTIEVLMARMEEMAGAPKQAMGIRTPGEKTAFEVQSLENAAGRIFQEKVINFERSFIEPALNVMLALARKEMAEAEVVRVLDQDLGVEEFLTVTKEDITARGKLRPVGARHFAQQAQLLQGLSQVFTSGLAPKVERHFSGKALSKLVEDGLQLGRHKIVRPNVGVMEDLETQKLAQAGQAEAEAEGTVPEPGQHE